MKMLKSFLLGVFAAVLMYGIFSMLTPKPVYQNVVVTVKAGDTIWGIASKYATDDEDTREVVYRIKETNHLNNSYMINLGDKLVIPVKAN